ncbi:hypothetical protein E2C01_039460 [Portunus trituberculatus]|uniref:Uncharacterized protein n=1 Tax=Portunus trituberculatus TaxID=210409 RepID=A0A5B7FN41_PORTR|nr:hypothetical protein [Portunus trituberculatus]
MPQPPGNQTLGYTAAHHYLPQPASRRLPPPAKDLHKHDPAQLHSYHCSHSLAIQNPSNA